MQKYSFTLILIFISSWIFAQKDFEISSLFGNNMILQSEKPFTINGTGTKGDKINIELKTDVETIKKTTKVDRSGKWNIEFPALDPNIECSLTIGNKTKTIGIEHIKTGDIWVIIGGSNTVHLLGNADLFEEEKAKNDSLNFNYLILPKESALQAQALPGSVKWQQHNHKNLAQTPSIAYYLETSLSKYIDVPVGIINCGYGGSTIETWMNATDLGYTSKDLALKNKKEKQQHSESMANDFEDQFSYPIKIDKLNEDRTQFSVQSLDDSGWDVTLVPETFKYKGLADFDGVVWFRKTVFIPEGVSIDTISMGFADDSDEVYINGKFVGGIPDGYGKPRIYPIPNSLLKPGNNSIAVRVRDIGGGGGLYGNPSDYYLSGNKFTIDISGNWKYRIEAIETDVPMNDIRRPSMLYNQMVNPITKFPVKGIVWYQGEVEAAHSSDFSDYQQKLKALINGYRREFNDENLPFIIVQLPSYGSNDSTQYNSWIDFKYAQELVANKMPNTEIISITDFINTKNNFDIHLSNHKATGTRIAKASLHAIYKHKAGSLCPKFSTLKIENNKIILSFENAKQLIAHNDYFYVKGFEVASSNKKFDKVQAQIINQNQIEIKLNTPNHNYLRYCGYVNAIDGNIYNEEQMPLMPFTINLKK